MADQNHKNGRSFNEATLEINELAQEDIQFNRYANLVFVLTRFFPTLIIYVFHRFIIMGEDGEVEMKSSMNSATIQSFLWEMNVWQNVCTDFE